MRHPFPPPLLFSSASAVPHAIHPCCSPSCLLSSSHCSSHRRLVLLSISLAPRAAFHLHPLFHPLPYLPSRHVHPLFTRPCVSFHPSPPPHTFPPTPSYFPRAFCPTALVVVSLLSPALASLLSSPPRSRCDLPIHIVLHPSIYTPAPFTSILRDPSMSIVLILCPASRVRIRLYIFIPASILHPSYLLILCPRVSLAPFMSPPLSTCTSFFLPLGSCSRVLTPSVRVSPLPTPPARALAIRTTISLPAT
ncbi:hypothetical protein C8R44DRAFT_879629 [Mycena epipterygia]|nr:hypothetical protein C8R44DRAFT_879629 [Mycena epipterygia]